MGLTQKILLFTGMLIVALAGITLAFTTFQADRLARDTIREGLQETREVWKAIQADRFDKLRLGVRVLANDPYFKAAMMELDQATTLDSLHERGMDLDADFMLATDWDGILVARTDDPAASGDDLSEDPLVVAAFEGEESASLWREGDDLATAVAVPMLTGPEFVGVLIAGYVIDEEAASQLRRLTRSEIAYVLQERGQPRLVVSSLGPREGALTGLLNAPEIVLAGEEPFEIDLAGERFIGVRIPLLTSDEEEIGAALALRSLSAETAGFRQFRASLIEVSLGVMVLALLLAWFAASRITGPVRTLVGLVERARDGSFSGAVSVETRDEIGVLARAFNGLLADLREKDEAIQYLREGLTALREATASRPAEPAPTDETLAAADETLRLPAGGALKRGEIFASRYEILHSVGKGGMGVVYRARDRQLDEEVALKLLRAEAIAKDPSLLDRFKREVKHARRITHHNVLRTHDFGEADGVPFISMEYLEGVTLKQLVRSRGALPLGVALNFAKQMCRGLAAAHQRGVVHRDIKPQNMLILPESSELKIMDFGIAGSSQVGKQDPSLTTEGMVMGTPDYMSPEQAQGRPADFRSDIYSLGVVLFESLTGKLPFRGETVTQIVIAHIQQAPPRPRALKPDLPLDLETAVLRCLVKEPTKRWQSVDELLEVLSAVSTRADVA
ncbi:MAG: protein kinase [Acidobacteriota bacterium]